MEIERNVSLEKLMERYADGDFACFDQLSLILMPLIVVSLERWLPETDSIGDACQAVLIELDASRARYQKDVPVAAWCLTIARKVAKERLRSTKSSLPPAPGAPAEPIPAEESAPRWDLDDGKAVVEALRANIQALASEMPEIVRLRALETEVVARLAQMLGIGHGTADVNPNPAYNKRACWLDRVLRRR